jgi:hypothetical protein
MKEFKEYLEAIQSNKETKIFEIIEYFRNKTKYEKNTEWNWDSFTNDKSNFKKLLLNQIETRNLKIKNKEDFEDKFFKLCKKFFFIRPSNDKEFNVTASVINLDPDFYYNLKNLLNKETIEK